MEYWTGRYVSRCDHLRLEDMSKITPFSPSSANNKKLDELFDSSEKARIKAALIELRRSCRTPEAFKSFEEFETELLKKTGISRQSLQRAGSLSSDLRNTDATSRWYTRGGVRPVGWNLPRSPRNMSTPTSTISSVKAEAVITGGPTSFYGAGGLAKSKTTGNLASFIPTFPRWAPLPTATSESKLSNGERSSHKRRTSYFESSPEVRNKAMEEREERAARRAAGTHKRSFSGIRSLGLVKSESKSRIDSMSPRESVHAEPYYAGTTGGKVDKFDSVSGPLDCAMLESGHAMPPPPTRNSISPRVDLVKVPGGGKEKVIRSRRRTERQISGDLVKNLFGAGMREVRKMGRRVGSMSWAESSDDLLGMTKQK